MSGLSDFSLLLEATISDLETRKTRGERFVQVSPQVLAELAARPANPPPAAAGKPNMEASAAPGSSQGVSMLASMKQALSEPRREVSRSHSEPPVAPPAKAVVAPAASVSVSVSAGVGVAPSSKVMALQQLQQKVQACTRCPNLVASRTNTVFGVGNPDSPLMFVGEAPGADEDVQGEPFVGAAGQLLTRIIQTMGLSRSDVYIANILKCRPDTPGQAYGNRKPTAEEMKTCLPYLLEQIQIIQPKVIVALGATAMEGLFGKSPVYITKLRGHWQDFQGIAVMPTFHPSYVLRNQSLSTKRETWEDMLAAMERLGMPVSEKQRSYFLKA